MEYKTTDRNYTHSILYTYFIYFVSFCFGNVCWKINKLSKLSVLIKQFCFLVEVSVTIIVLYEWIYIIKYFFILFKVCYTKLFVQQEMNTLELPMISQFVILNKLFIILSLSKTLQKYF